MGQRCATNLSLNFSLKKILKIGAFFSFVLSLVSVSPCTSPCFWSLCSVLSSHISSLVHISHPESSPEQHRCFLLLNAAVEKELQRQYMEVVVSPPETRLGQYSKEEQQSKTTSSLIPSSCGTCKHYWTKTDNKLASCYVMLA